MNAVAVPFNAATGNGMTGHFRSNGWYKTVGTVFNNKSQNLLLHVQRRNSESLYDFPGYIFYLVCEK
jgi:hypothetical protein